MEQPLERQPLERQRDDLVVRSHRAQEWRAWHRRLAYFTAVISRPKESEGDAFMLGMRCADDTDASSRIADLGGVTGKLGITGIPVGGDGRAYVSAPFRGGFTISVSGAAGNSYEVTDADVEVCLDLERRIDAYGWGGDVDILILERAWWPPCILSPARYPELH